MEFAPVDVVSLISVFLWFGLVVFLVIVFHEPIRRDLLPRLGGLNVMGVELSFVKRSMDDAVSDAVQLAEKYPTWKVDVPDKDKERVLNRVKQNVAVFRDAQILWVDDHPEYNRNERKMFRRLGVEIDIGKSTKEALEMLRNQIYDLVISDMARDTPTAGLDFIAQFRKEDGSTPLIFYIGEIDPTKGVPPGAFGITNRPDELLNLTLDALERRS
jgi:CheY-like chemotaxis protein